MRLGAVLLAVALVLGGLIYAFWPISCFVCLGIALLGIALGWLGHRMDRSKGTSPSTSKVALVTKVGDENTSSNEGKDGPGSSRPPAKSKKPVKPRKPIEPLSRYQKIGCITELVMMSSLILAFFLLDGWEVVQGLLALLVGVVCIPVLIICIVKEIQRKRRAKAAAKVALPDLAAEEKGQGKSNDAPPPGSATWRM